MQKRARVTRREAAQILGISVSYVRKLCAQRKLTFEPDRFGTFQADREQIETFARERGTRVTTNGVLAARVFALFKVERAFADIVMETNEDPAKIQELRERYDAGFAYGKQEAKVAADERRQREHEKEMREMDAEIERRRRAALAEDDSPSNK
jgi:hypothetical protein